MPDIAFGPATPSDAPKKLPKVTIRSPGAEQAIAADKAKDFDVKIDVKDWETQTGGPHVHLILDNKPYKPVYDPKTAVKLGDLVPAGESVGEGESRQLTIIPKRGGRPPGPRLAERPWATGSRPPTPEDT